MSKNIRVHLAVAQFIQSGEETSAFLLFAKKFRRRAEGIRKVVTHGGAQLKWAVQSDGVGMCDLTGTWGPCGLFYFAFEDAEPTQETTNEPK